MQTSGDLDLLKDFAVLTCRYQKKKSLPVEIRRGDPILLSDADAAALPRWARGGRVRPWLGLGWEALPASRQLLSSI